MYVHVRFRLRRKVNYCRSSRRNWRWVATGRRIRFFLYGRPRLFIRSIDIRHSIEYQPVICYKSGSRSSSYWKVTMIKKSYFNNKKIIFYWYIVVVIEIFNNVIIMINNIDRGDRIYWYDNASKKFISTIRDTMGSSVPIHHFLPQRNRRIRGQLQSF